MAKPLMFALSVQRCSYEKEGAEPHGKYVLVANVPGFPPTCVVCLAAAMDLVMGWHLSRVVIQAMAVRRNADEQREEIDRWSANLPAELRPKRRK